MLIQTRNAPAAAQSQRDGPPPHQGTRRASIAASTYDATSRTVDAVFSAGARVLRYFGFEELAIEPAAVDLSRVTLGRCPLLNAHNQYDIGATLGMVESARIEGGQVVGRLRFADTDAGRAAEGMVQRGELTGISIGYSVRSWQLVETTDAGADVWRAAQWELLEVSIVPVPADPAAGFRSAATTEQEEIDEMLRRNQPTNPAAAPAPAQHDPTPAAVTARAITTAARNAGLDLSAVDDMLARHESAPFNHDTMMADIGRRFAERDSGARTVNRVSVTGPDPARAMIGRMEDAIFARMSGERPSEQARELMGVSLTGMARMLLEQAGVNVRYMSDAAVLDHAMTRNGGHTTSDFYNLLTQGGSRYLVSAYETAASAIKAVARQRTARDFRDITLLSLSNAPALEKLNENGEIRHGTFTEGKETYRLSTFAKIFALSRQAIINDDLGAFADALGMMARAAAETEATELASLLNANSGAGPKMSSDNKTLFHTDHANIAAAGSALSVASLSDGRLTMRNQKDRDGKTFLNIVPKTLLVPPSLETLAEQVLTAIDVTKTADVNPFPGKITPAVEPRLTGNGWRLFADPSQAPVLEYAYLDGAQGPQLAQRDGWNTLGTEFRVVLDFGCAAVDTRGGYYNPGG